ncbi:hypothetical protein V1281_007529 [Nitrobacteraceae bacterium AZCC 2161]
MQKENARFEAIPNCKLGVSQNGMNLKKPLTAGLKCFQTHASKVHNLCDTAGIAIAPIVRYLSSFAT